MFMLIKNVEKPKLPKLIWALRKQFRPETLICNQPSLLLIEKVGYKSAKHGVLMVLMVSCFILLPSRVRLYARAETL